MPTFVNTRFEDSIFYIGINRVDKKNCVNDETANELYEAFKEFNSNPDIKIGILYGEGGNFCSGYDLNEVYLGNLFYFDPTTTHERRYMGPSIMKLKKPLIAAIEGYAVAGGLELALMADLRVCARSSTLGVFCRRIGVPLIDGGTVRLPRIVGISRALDLVLTGRAVTADEAYQWGLVNRIVDDGEALSTATSLAKEIIVHPYSCMIADRNSLLHSYDCSTKDAFDFEFNSTAVLNESIKGATRFIMDKMRAKL